MLKKLIGPVLLFILAFSCLEEPECIGLNNNLIGLSFVNLDTEASDSVTLDSLFIDGKKIFYAATDSGLYYIPYTTEYNDTTVSLASMVLPLNYLQEETIVVFGFEDHSDTLALKYKSQSQFVSEQCGQRFVLSDLSAASPDIDSIRIVSEKPGTSTVKTKNIEIYFE